LSTLDIQRLIRNFFLFISWWRWS